VAPHHLRVKRSCHAEFSAVDLIFRIVIVSAESANPKKIMNSELSKTISTCAIWLSVACILTFGFFKMNISGDAAFIILLLVPALTVLGAVGATTVIWKPPREDKKPADSAPLLNPTPSAPPIVKS